MFQLSLKRFIPELALLINAADGRAGEDVVELIEQSLAPDLAEAFRGIGTPLLDLRKSAERLSLAEESLKPAVVIFDHTYARQAALMILHIELAAVDGKICANACKLPEKFS